MVVEVGKLKFGAFSRLSLQDEVAGAAAAAKKSSAVAAANAASDPLMDLFQVEKDSEEDSSSKEQHPAKPERKVERKVSYGAADSPSNSSLGSKEDLRPRTASASSRRSLGGLSGGGEPTAVAMTPPKARLSPFLTTQMQRTKEEFEFLELKTPFSGGGGSGGASAAGGGIPKSDSANSVGSSSSAVAAGDLGIFFKGPPAAAAASSSATATLGTISEQQHSVLTTSGGFVATCEEGSATTQATSSSAVAAGEDVFQTSIVEEINAYESKQAEMDEMIKNLETSESESEMW